MQPLSGLLVLDFTTLLPGPLAALMLAIYLGFIFAVAFAHNLMAMKIGAGVTSLGILLGLLVIVSAFLLTGIYVWRANTAFDDLTRDLRKEFP